MQALYQLSYSPMTGPPGASMPRGGVANLTRHLPRSAKSVSRTAGSARAAPVCRAGTVGRDAVAQPAVPRTSGASRCEHAAADRGRPGLTLSSGLSSCGRPAVIAAAVCLVSFAAFWTAQRAARASR